MSAAFCSKCGKPVYPGGSFCGFCATPVAVANAPVDAGPDASGAQSTGSSDLESMARALGAITVRNFVVRQEGNVNQPRFVVTDPTDRLLFVLQNTNVQARLALEIGGRPRGTGGENFGAMSPTRTWSLVDGAGTPTATLAFQHGGSLGDATLDDISGSPLLRAHSDPQGFGGYSLTSSLPDGTPYIHSAGKINRGEQEYRDASGTPVARVHFPTVAARETIYVDLGGSGEPIGPVVLAFFVSRLEK